MGFSIGPGGVIYPETVGLIHAAAVDEKVEQSLCVRM